MGNTMNLRSISIAVLFMGLCLGQASADCLTFTGSPSGNVTYNNTCGRTLTVVVALPNWSEIVTVGPGVTVRREPNGYLHYYSCYAPATAVDNSTRRTVTYNTPTIYGPKGFSCH
jgi:hypothetical protein